MAKRGSKFLKEFKEFAVKGSMFDMAIGVIIGGVFKDLVTSFTNNIIMPIISIFTGSIDFSSWKIRLPSLFGDKINPETGEILANAGEKISEAKAREIQNAGVNEVFVLVNDPEDGEIRHKIIANNTVDFSAISDIPLQADRKSVV